MPTAERTGVTLTGAGFVLHDNREIKGTLGWGLRTSASTLKGKENPLEIRGIYKARWNECSSPPGTGYTRFRYLLLGVNPHDC